MSSSSSSTGQLLQSVQSPSPALLQDPALLHQLLPALQATLQMNNGSMDMAKLNEGEGAKDDMSLKFPPLPHMLFSSVVSFLPMMVFVELFSTMCAPDCVTKQHRCGCCIALILLVTLVFL